MNLGSEIGFALLVWGLGGVTGWMLGSTPPSTPRQTEAKVVYNNSGSLIPRLDANGKAVCHHE